MVQQLFDYIETYFDSESVEGQPENKENPDNVECTEDAYQPEELEDSDPEDEELARALGAPSSNLQGSSESLHTGLTDEFQTKLAISSPKQTELPEQPTPTATPPRAVKTIIILDGEDEARTPAAKKAKIPSSNEVKMERIELLKCLGAISLEGLLLRVTHTPISMHQLRREIAKRQQSLVCARPWIAPPPGIDCITSDTLPFDLSPVAKDLREKFEAEDSKIKQAVAFREDGALHLAHPVEPPKDGACRDRTFLDKDVKPAENTLDTEVKTAENTLDTEVKAAENTLDTEVKAAENTLDAEVKAAENTLDTKVKLPENNLDTKVKPAEKDMEMPDDNVALEEKCLQAIPPTQPDIDLPEDDLFHTETKDFITREAQFQHKKEQASDPAEEDLFEEEPENKKAKKGKGRKVAKRPATKKGAEKAKAAPKAKGRPKAKAKAKTRARATAKKPDTTAVSEDAEHQEAEDEGEADAEEAPKKKAARGAGHKPKATFARRYRPELDAWAGLKWDSIKDAFNLHLRHRLMNVSKMEAPRQEIL